MSFSELRNVVAIYKTDKLFLSKNKMTTKTRGSEKVPYSKGSCSRFNFCNELIKYSLFLVFLSAMINIEERTFAVSPYVTAV